MAQSYHRKLLFDPSWKVVVVEATASTSTVTSKKKIISQD